jgi:hypothetical protein
MSMFKSLLDEHQAKQSRLKEEVGASSAPFTNTLTQRTTRTLGVLQKHISENLSLFPIPLTPSSLPLSPPPPSLHVAEVSRRSALNAVSGLTESLVDTVNSGVVDVFENQKKIEEEARELQGKSAKFARVTSEWVRILNGGGLRV